MLAVCGDGGFMMSSQELETAVRLELDLVVLIIEVNAYGMIRWKQAVDHFPDFGMTSANPDFTWRVSFLAITAIGLVWLACWLFLVTDTPATNPRVGPAEKALVATSRAAAAAREGAHSSIGHWLKTPAVLAVALAFFSYNYVLYFFLTWLPTYLTSVHHLDITSMSLLTVIPGSAVASACSGAACCPTRCSSAPATRCCPARSCWSAGCCLPRCP